VARVGANGIAIQYDYGQEFVWAFA
jgi:hypothetical protein